MAKKMWQFKTRNFTVLWLITPDVFSVRGIAAPLAAASFCPEPILPRSIP